MILILFEDSFDLMKSNPHSIPDHASKMISYLESDHLRVKEAIGADDSILGVMSTFANSSAGMLANKSTRESCSGFWLNLWDACALYGLLADLIYDQADITFGLTSKFNAKRVNSWPDCICHLIEVRQVRLEADIDEIFPLTSLIPNAIAVCTYKYFAFDLGYCEGAPADVTSSQVIDEVTNYFES